MNVQNGGEKVCASIDAPRRLYILPGASRAVTMAPATLLDVALDVGAWTAVRSQPCAAWCVSVNCCVYTPHWPFPIACRVVWRRHGTHDAMDAGAIISPIHPEKLSDVDGSAYEKFTARAT